MNLEQGQNAGWKHPLLSYSLLQNHCSWISWEYLMSASNVVDLCVYFSIQFITSQWSWVNAFIPPFSLIFPPPLSSCSILIFPRLHPQPASLPHPPISHSLSQFRSCHHLPLFLLYFSPRSISYLLSPVATVPLSPAQALCMFSPHLLSPRISIPPSLPPSFTFSLSDERGSFERERERENQRRRLKGRGGSL